MAQAESDVQKYLAGVRFPATKDTLVEHAKRKGASEDVIEALSSMPGGAYDGPDRVSSAVGKS